MDNWQKALDNWLTSTPKEWDMERVTKDDLMDTDKESGVKYPTYVDELSCEDCGASIGWESHGGTFVEFFGDPSDTHYKCEDCHGEWLDMPEA
jgi:hypothetical protein